jgi:Cu/Ag efflux protein CusF
LVACRQTPRKAPAPLIYKVEGTVKRLVPENQIVVILHDTIANDAGEVWMEGGMAMDFPVREKSEFLALRRGQHIRARLIHDLDNYDYWIDKIEILQPAAH